jgi:hypothetical protein
MSPQPWRQAARLGSGGHPLSDRALAGLVRGHVVPIQAEIPRHLDRGFVADQQTSSTRVEDPCPGVVRAWALRRHGNLQA